MLIVTKVILGYGQLVSFDRSAKESKHLKGLLSNKKVSVTKNCHSSVCTSIYDRKVSVCLSRPLGLASLVQLWPSNTKKSNTDTSGGDGANKIKMVEKDVGDSCAHLILIWWW